MSSPLYRKKRSAGKAVTSLKKRQSKLRVQQDAQTNKITKYMTSRSENHRLPIAMEDSLSTEQIRGGKEPQLLMKLKQKDEEIKLMRRECAELASQINQEYILKRKLAKTIASSLLEVAELKRAEKRKIDNQLGYFTNNFRVFIESTGVKDIKKEILHLEAQIKSIPSKLKYSTQNQKNCLKSAFQYKSKRLEEAKQELELKQDEIFWYRQRLKLAEKEKNSCYCSQKWPIIYQNYQTLELLGAGGFAEVYKCFNLQSSQVVAVKKINFAQLAQSTYHKVYYHIERQIRIHSQLEHPNIVKLTNVLELNKLKKSALFQLEYCQGPQLSTYIKKYGKIEQVQAKTIIKQLLSALQYLHSQKEKVIHYDLKPSNIMFQAGVVKILDFGLCKAIKEDEATDMELTSQGVGTYWYLPPEAFASEDPKISSKVDIWSLGVIFYEMLYGVKPFGQGIPQSQIYASGIILQARHVQFPNDSSLTVSAAAKDFIKCCLRYNQNDRLNADQASSHFYIKY